jgi:hypothetical protein
VTEGRSFWSDTQACVWGRRDTRTIARAVPTTNAKRRTWSSLSSPVLPGGQSSAQRVPGVNSGTGDQGLSITGDGLELFFASAVTGVPHLVVSTRSCL